MRTHQLAGNISEPNHCFDDPPLACCSYHHQVPITVPNPLVQRDPVPHPASAAVPELSLQRPPPVNKTHVSGRSAKVAAPGPPEVPIGIRKAVVQADGRQPLAAVHPPARGDKVVIPVDIHMGRRGGEVAGVVLLLRRRRRRVLRVLGWLGRVRLFVLVLLLLVVVGDGVLQLVPGERAAQGAEEPVIHLVAGPRAGGAAG